MFIVHTAWHTWSNRGRKGWGMVRTWIYPCFTVCCTPLPPAIVCTISPSSIFSQGHECQRRVRYWAGMGGHAQGINPAEPNNHITKQFQHRCCNLLFLSQYWFSDNIVSLWIALASKTISGTISSCCVSGWHNFQHTHDIIITSACQWWI